MNIGIAKIGQKIYFNREDVALDRSNTNGNQGTYKMIKLLVDNNLEQNFYMLSESDLHTNIQNKPSNLHYYITIGAKLDFVFVFTGLGEYEKNNSMIEKLNKLYSDGTMFVFICEDPRCLESMNKDTRMTFVPRVIIGQTNETVIYKGKQRNMVYRPIEKAICYLSQNKIDWDKKETDLIAIANTSGDMYNRPEILHRLIGSEDVPVYGRLSEEEQKWFVNYKGEIKYNAMMFEMKRAWATIIIPIRKGWVTSKYVEALMNGVYPIFYKDYNTYLLGWEYLPVTIDNMDELGEAVRLIRANKTNVRKMVESWICTEIEPYISGKLLSKQIMEVIGL